MWLVMRGALAAQVRCLHRSYCLPSMTGIATAIYEPAESGLPEPVLQRHRQRIATQMQGAETLEGTYPFNLERSVRAYRLSRFLHGLIQLPARTVFLADEEAAYASAGLTEIERDLVRRRDWRGLIHYGVIFFLLEKLGAVLGVSNLHLYAAMRGETLEAFQATRNTRALYSVTGKDAGALGWDTAPSSPTGNTPNP